MRKIKDLLRLKYQQRLSHRQIAASLGIAVGSVHEYLQRADKAQVTWPQSERLSESESGEPPLSPVETPRTQEDSRCRTGHKSRANSPEKASPSCSCGKSIAQPSYRPGLQPVLPTLRRLQRDPRPHECASPTKPGRNSS